MKLNVVEVFDSMQGEGASMGTYCTFIRFPGCNFSCPFCDTSFNKADYILDTDEQVMQKHVVITGGEPTIHPDFEKLVKVLQRLGHIIHVETNGTNIGLIPSGCWITCSPKNMKWKNVPDGKVDWWNHLSRINELKLVVDETFDPTTWVNKTPRLIWLQPCDGPYFAESRNRILKIIKEYPETFRAGIQLHKWYEVQ